MTWLKKVAIVCFKYTRRSFFKVIQIIPRKERCIIGGN
jgi:hypothetical protein